MQIVHKKMLIGASIASLFLGFLFFLIYHNILIVRLMHSPKHNQQQEKQEKKNITIFMWAHATWQQETTEIIWGEQLHKNLEYILNKWLSIVEEEGYMNKKVAVQSVALSANQQEAYVSFDQYPFDPQISTQEKYYWVEGILKTLRTLDTPLKTIYFLVHHKPIEDYTLDFSFPWPLESFDERDKTS